LNLGVFNWAYKTKNCKKIRNSIVRNYWI